MQPRLIQLNISPGGMPKRPVPQAKVARAGIEGDAQKNLKYHGGADRAVCLFSQELYDWLRQQHNIDLQRGSVGENFTTIGIDLDALSVGDRLQVGSCEIELTAIRVPCKSLLQWHPQLLKAINGHSGWVAKVLTEALVRPGDRIIQCPRQSPHSSSSKTSATA